MLDIEVSDAPSHPEWDAWLSTAPGGHHLQTSGWGYVKAGSGWREGSVGHVALATGTKSLAGYTLHSGQPVIAEDLTAETRFEVPPLLQEHGVMSSMMVIIPGNGRPFGVLVVDSLQRSTFGPDDVYTLQAAAGLLGQWLQREYGRALAHMPRLDEVSRWITVRSSALALAWQGDDEPLRRFVAGFAESDAFNQANLNYWAYWVGDIPDPQPNDGFMFSDMHAWSGVRVMEHLLDRLHVRHAPLNIRRRSCLPLLRG
jgi:hypothetical protein